MYSYFHRCIREDCPWNTKQLGQKKGCPIHHGSKSMSQIIVSVPQTLSEWETVKPTVDAENNLVGSEIEGSLDYHLVHHFGYWQDCYMCCHPHVSPEIQADMKKDHQNLSAKISAIINCNCMRTYPLGHHWEICPAFDSKIMKTSEEFYKEMEYNGV